MRWRQTYAAAAALAVAAFAGSCRGRQWRVLTTEGHADVVSILSLVFTDNQHGWAATSTHVFESEDGGRSWKARMAESAASFQALVFRDERRGWVFGSRGNATSQKGAIWRTADGGGTWSESPTSVPGPIVSASFCDTDLGFAVGPEQALRTTDGGVTWTVSFQGTPTDQLLGVRCSGRSEAWAVGSKGTVLQTVDGGVSWQRRELGGANANLTRVYFEQSRGWIVGFHGLLLASEDGGRTWKQVPVPTNEALLDIHVDGVEGWIVGTHGTILRSADGGRTWRMHESPTDKDLVALSFLASGGGWAGGSQMTVLRLAK